MSPIWDIVCSLLSITCSRTTSFHPQSNSLVERFHRSLKSSLRARLASPDWCDHLPLVMLGLPSPESFWILTSSHLQFSRTGSSLLYMVWSCLLFITGFHLLLKFQRLWPPGTMFLSVRMLLFILYPNSTEAPSESCLVPTSFVLYRWVPGRSLSL